MIQCHPELDSGSQGMKPNRALNQVQNDVLAYNFKDKQWQ